MPAKYKAEPHHASRVEQLLHEAGATHLRARTYGATVIVQSGPTKDPVKHFRLRRATAQWWFLEPAGRGGRWEKTPFRGNIQEMVSMAVDTFPWILTEIA